MPMRTPSPSRRSSWSSKGGSATSTRRNQTKPEPSRPCRDMTPSPPHGASVRRGDPGSGASVRPFGRAADLDVAFEGVERPLLVTALLAQCSEDADAEAWWAQRVSTRIAALLRLAALSDGVETLAAHLRCPQPECGCDFEVVLPASALPDAPASDRIAVPLPDGRHARVRQPTGQDQRRWSQRSYASHDEAVAAVVDALLLEGQVAVDDQVSLVAIATALADHDPLVDFTVSCTCPACAQPVEAAI